MQLFENTTLEAAVEAYAKKQVNGDQVRAWLKGRIARMENLALMTASRAFGDIGPGKNGEPAVLDLILARLNAKQAKAPSGKLTIMLGKAGKGNISIYGLQKMPFTFYAEQLERLLAAADEIKAFIAENDSALARKSRDASVIEGEPAAA